MVNRTSRAEWEERIAQFLESGLDADTFAARAGVTTRQLQWWRWRLAQGATPSTPTTTSSPIATTETQMSANTALSFVRLDTHEIAPATTPSIELVLRCGLSLRISVGFDAATLARVVDLLDGDAR